VSDSLIGRLPTNRPAALIRSDHLIDITELSTCAVEKIPVLLLVRRAMSGMLWLMSLTENDMLGQIVVSNVACKAAKAMVFAKLFILDLLQFSGRVCHQPRYNCRFHKGTVSFWCSTRPIHNSCQ